MKFIRMPSWAKYFMLTYGITWFFWGIAVFLRLPISAMPIPILIAVGGIGPVASALILSYSIEKKSYRVSYWQRFLDVRRMGWKWLLGSFLVPVVMTIVAGCLDQLLHGNGLSIPDRFSQNFFSLIPFAIFSLFFGPIPEEMGWRGYALGKLQGKFNPLAASLILGCVWFVWHIPLFFIPDSYQNSLVVNRQIPLWFFPANIILQTISMTYIFNQTRGSTLSAVIFHFSVNFCGEMFAISPRGAFFQILLWAFTAAAICLHWSRNKNSDNRSLLS